jgi:hypothetical protein
MQTEQTGQRKDADTRTKRMSRRGFRRAKRPSWVSRLRRMNRALAASRRIADAAWDALGHATERAARSPIRTSREMHRLGKRLIDAMERLERAVLGLGETTESMARERRGVPDAPRLLTEATARWIVAARIIAETSDQLCIVQENLLQDVLSGAIVAEDEQPRRRMRITGAPHLISARDFLLCRRKSAHDRIASIPARRRRTACRAAADAPRRISRGRAPPAVSHCQL